MKAAAKAKSMMAQKKVNPAKGGRYLEHDGPKLTDRQNADFKEAFSLLDKDKDNKISCEELVDLMRKLNLTSEPISEEEVMELINEVDVNSDGSIDWTEFVTMMARKLKYEDDVHEEVKEAWKVFGQVSGTEGYFRASELKDVMNKLGEQLTDAEIDEMIGEVDKDKDGRISYSEFYNMMMESEPKEGSEENKDAD